mgnify:FL=1
MDAIKLSETPKDVADMVAIYKHGITFACLEKVGSRPFQGLSSTFKFGWSAGFCEALLVCNAIRFETYVPSLWMRKMKILTPGIKGSQKKNIHKRRAQELFPNLKPSRFTHAYVDALLLAEFARRLSLALELPK